MVIMSNLKQKFGQDLGYVQEKITQLNDELSGLLLNPEKNESEITYIRGKLLKYMRQEIDLTPDSDIKEQKSLLLNFEINKHKQQLSKRIRTNKKSEDNRLSSEIGLKIQKTINSYKQISLSSDNQELAGNIAKSIGNTISTIGSVAKIPAIGFTKIVKSGAKLTAKVVTSPLHIYGYLLGKVINPDSPYKGKVVGKMSDGLEELITSVMEKQEEIIRRL